MFTHPDIKSFEPTPYEYPRGYFDIQYQFAQEVVRIGITPDIPTAVAKYTSIPRRLFGKDYVLPSNWPDLCHSSTVIWNTYTKENAHFFVSPEPINDGCHHGSFIYKPYPDTDLIIDRPTGLQKMELHFNNHRGHVGEYSRSNLSTLTTNLSDLFQSVADRKKADPNFRPEVVTLGSWMNNFTGIQQALPSEFVDSSVVVRPPNLSFAGDSLWGQFLTNNAGINKQYYQHFSEKIATAADINDLVDAFPMPVLFSRSIIKPFFDKYQTKL
ncbi:MAG: hypothetical protein WAV41_00325 [Microgenomates group bacterium]